MGDRADQVPFAQFPLPGVTRFAMIKEIYPVGLLTPITSKSDNRLKLR